MLRSLDYEAVFFPANGRTCWVRLGEGIGKGSDPSASVSRSPYIILQMK